MMRKRKWIITAAATALAAVLLVPTGAFAAGTPSVTMEKAKEANTYHLKYTGSPSDSGKLINVFAYKTVKDNDTKGDAITDAGFLDGDTAVIGTDGTFTLDLKLKSSSGASIYLGGEDSLLPGGASPDLQQSLRVPGVPSGVKAAASGYDAVKLTWNAVPGAKNYQVYRATSAAGLAKAPVLATVSASKGTVYQDSKLATGTKYFYAVREYAAPLTGEMSANAAATPVLAKPAISKVKSGKRQLTVSWKKVAGASGYWVYSSKKKSSGYRCVKKISKAGTVKFTHKKLKKNKKYYYKIRAYRTVNGKKVWSAYSAVKSQKTKKK